MHEAAAELEFEEAARLRDEIRRLQEAELRTANDPLARPDPSARPAAPGRSTAGRPGTRHFKKKSKSRGRF
jgi:excinuclease ABC subunit B